METHTHSTYWAEYNRQWQDAMKLHYALLGELIERQDLGRIQLHAWALRLIATNDYNAYKEFCEQAEHDLAPVESWQIEWRE